MDQECNMAAVRWVWVAGFGLTLACASTRSTQPSGPPGRITDRDSMVRLSAATFSMGADQGETDETPLHTVSLKAFWLDRTEVTNRDYRACVSANVCGPAQSLDVPGMNGDSQPVTGVSWYDADKFCRWAEKRLPTEAEWERAARGAENRQFPWGSKYENNRANMRGDADGFKKTAPVGKFPAGVSREAALHDLSGNAAEWVNDWYDPAYYRSQETFENPQGPDGIGGDKVVRGGSYVDPDFNARVSSRSRMEINNRSDAVGFRCAQDE
jgi:sulfatase modifying factor 1